MKVAILSDPHIGSQKPVFVPNWQAVVDRVNARPDVDLVVILGDLTLDGVLLDADCAFGADAISALNAPVLVLPGNHDVGDIARDGKAPVDAERLTRWEAHFGPCFWQSDAIEGWRLIGVNSQLIGSGLAVEATQWTALEAALQTNRQTILLTHMPLFLTDWNEADRPAWALKRKDRLRLRDLLRDHGTEAVLSAHMHRAASLRRPGDPAFIWTPASSFLTHDASIPEQLGAEMLGYTLLDLGATLREEFIAVEGLEKIYIEETAGSIYASPAKDA